MRIIPFLILNIIVSEATVLIVLNWWSSTHPPAPLPPVVFPTEIAPSPLPPRLTDTPRTGEPRLLQVIDVLGAGDVKNEVVHLKYDGEGELRLAGWKITRGTAIPSPMSRSAKEALCASIPVPDWVVLRTTQEYKALWLELGQQILANCQMHERLRENEILVKEPSQQLGIPVKDPEETLSQEIDFLLQRVVHHANRPVLHGELQLG